MDRFLQEKRVAAKKAAAKIPPGISLGLGSGSTAEIFIEEIARLPEIQTCKLFCSSARSEAKAKELRMAVFPLENCERVDIMVDGADAADGQSNLLKGFGGALTREKLLASIATELWILVDSRKIVAKLPLERLPCEILPCAYSSVRAFLQKKGYASTLRTKASVSTDSGGSTDSGKKIWHTENGGWLLDLDCSSTQLDLDSLDLLLQKIPGLIETGLFLNFSPVLFDGKQ